MKKILTAALALLLSLAAFAATNYNHVVVITLKDGSTAQHLFAHNPTSYFDNAGRMYLGTSSENGVNSYAYEVENIESITYKSDRTNSIADIEASSTATFAFDGDNLVLAGFSPKAPVALYNLAGLVLFAGSADENGQASIALGDLQPGTYIATAGSQSFKFIKK